MGYLFARTSRLEIGYLEWNPKGRHTAILVHGWPDSAESWRDVAAALAASDYRVVCPALRGFGPTTFLNSSTPRSGQLAALGRDLLEFSGALGLVQPVLVGHDWGARAVANACGLRAKAASHLVMLSVGYGTNDPRQPLSYSQVRNYWYHWFMATERGAEAIKSDRRRFARLMWETWSPTGWFSEKDFEEAARAFDNPDWAEVVLHSYRHRWGFVPGDSTYDADEARLNPAPILSVPTLVLHGAADTCNHPDSSSGKERFFEGAYRRQLLDRVGHFPQRESPQEIARAIVEFCANPS